MIYVNNLAMHFGTQVLFENATFQLNKGYRYGLVGANGSGKSTLLKILAREVQPESGEFSYASSIKFGVLKQDHFAYEDFPVIDVVLMGRAELWDALQKKRALIEVQDVSAEGGHKLAELEMKIADLGGYEAESEAAELLSGLGISADRHCELLNAFSGGYKLRVLLAQCLFSEPDFLLLDEPTNHLDLLSIIWLEDYLCRFKGTCLIISHDQYFLNRISTHIMDIDYEEIKIYTGNYQQFIEAKELERIQKEKGIQQQEKKKEELQQFIDRFKAKATKARQANSKAKQLDRMDEITIKRTSRISPSFNFDLIRPSGRMIFEVSGLSKAFGDHKVLDDISFKMERGEKVAVIGQNGIGKSTLLKILGDKLLASSGDILKGHEVHTGYCPQDHQELIQPGTSPYEWLYSFSPGETIGVIRGLLGRVLIQGDDVKKSTESLSGGESARLIFSKLMLQKPNLLLLDEPTNHMDIESLEALSEALQRYEGSIVCVSHDRRFIETFATSILELRSDGYELFKGTYQEFLEKKGVDYLDRNAARLDGKKDKSKKKVSLESKEWRKLSKEVSKLEKAVDKREKEVSKLEEELFQLEEKLGDPALYNEENKTLLDQKIKEKAVVESRLEKVMEDWENLQANLEVEKAKLNGDFTG